MNYLYYFNWDAIFRTLWEANNWTGNQELVCNVAPENLFALKRGDIMMLETVESIDPGKELFAIYEYS